MAILCSMLFLAMFGTLRVRPSLRAKPLPLLRRAR
jgi:hypothetical protein